MCQQMGAEQPSRSFVLRRGLSPTTTFCSVSCEHHRGMIQTLNVSQSAAPHLMPLREFNQGNAALARLRRSPPCCCCCRRSVVAPEEASEVRNISCESKYHKSQRHEKRRRNTKETSVCGWDNKDFMQPIPFWTGMPNKSVYHKYISVLLQWLWIHNAACFQSTNHKCCKNSAQF